MQKCTAKVKTQMTKTNAIKGGKNCNKNKAASEKNILNESAPFFVPQCTQTNTRHPFASDNRPRQPQQHKTTIISNFFCSFLSRFFFLKTRATATSSTATCTIPAFWLDDQILFRLHEAEQCLRKHQFTAEPSWLDLSKERPCVDNCVASQWPRPGAEETPGWKFRPVTSTQFWFLHMQKPFNLKLHTKYWPHFRIRVK